MAGNIGQFAGGERAFQDVAGSTAAVADTSGVSKINTITGALNAFSSVVGTATDIATGLKQQEAAKAAALNEEEYSQGLMRIRDMASQLGASDPRVADSATKLFNNSPLAHDIKTKMTKDLQGTFLGKAFTEVSEDDKAEKEFNDRFTKSRFYNRHATLEKQEQNMVDYEDSLLDTEKHNLAMRKLTLQAAVAQGDKTAEDKVAAELELEKTKEISRIVLDQPATLTANIAALEEIYEDDIAKGVDPAVAVTALKRALEAEKVNVKSGYTRIASQSKTGLPVHLGAASDVADEMYDNAIKFAGTAQVASERESSLNNVKLTTQIKMLNQSKALSVASAVADLVKGAGSGISIDVLTDVNNYYLGAEERDDGATATNLNPNDKGVDEYYEGLRANLDNVGKTNPDGTSVVNEEALSKQISNVLGYTSDSEGRLDLGEYSRAVAEIAKPSFGTFLKKVRGKGLNETDLARAQAAIGRYTEDVGDSFNAFLRTTLSDAEKAKKVAGAQPRGRHTISRKVTEEQLELVYMNDRVVFQGTDERSRVFAEGLNRRMSTQLTNTVWANSNIGSSSPEQVFNNWLPQLWTEKYGEQAEQQEGGAQETPAVLDGDGNPLVKGQPYVDENGDTWFFDGTDLKIGSSADGS